MKSLGILLTLTALALPLAGCTSTSQDPFLTAATGVAAAPPISVEVSPQFALAALPPSAGRTVSVQQVVRENGLGQTVVYANRTALSGDNTLTIEVSNADAATRPVRAPTRGEIRKEMAETLPGIAMRIDDVIGDNAQGVFGYALGTSGGAHCLYGWQVVKSGATVQRPYAARLRLRFCDPSMSEAELVSLMQGVRLLPVSKETVAMLRKAPGRAYVMPASLAPEVAAEPVSPRHSRQRRSTAAPVEQVEAAAVAVPLPGEASARPAAVTAPAKMPAASPQIGNAAIVPLPQ